MLLVEFAADMPLLAVGVPPPYYAAGLSLPFVVKCHIAWDPSVVAEVVDFDRHNRGLQVLVVAYQVVA